MILIFKHEVLQRTARISEAGYVSIHDERGNRIQGESYVNQKIAVNALGREGWREIQDEDAVLSPQKAAR